MKLTLIAAYAKDSQGRNVIGKDEKILWHFPEDLINFMGLTIRNTVIMGRKTLDSLPFGKPLPNRNNIVVTRNQDYNRRGVITAISISEALEAAKSLDKENYVIGGHQIYEQTIDFADRLEITEVKRNYEGDTFFPKIDLEKWEETNRNEREHFDFVSYKRKI